MNCGIENKGLYKRGHAQEKDWKRGSEMRDQDLKVFISDHSWSRGEGAKGLLQRVWVQG